MGESETRHRLPRKRAGVQAVTPLPCPFCHSADVTAEQALRGHGKSIDVECQNCGGRLVGIDAVERWNQAIRPSEARRAPAVKIEPGDVTLPGHYWMRQPAKNWQLVKVSNVTQDLRLRAWIAGKPYKTDSMRMGTQFVGPLEAPE
jgi:hypothetical protein